MPRISLQLGSARCGNVHKQCRTPPDHAVQERSFRQSCCHPNEISPRIFHHNPTTTRNLTSRSTCTNDAGLLRPWTKLFLQDLREIRLPTSTRVHRATHAPSQQANVFQIRSVLTSEPFLLLVRELDKSSSHSYTVDTADVVHCKRSLAFRLFLIVGDEQREVLLHFPRVASADEFSCGGNIGFLQRRLDLSHYQTRPAVGSVRIDLVSVNPTKRHLLHPCPDEGRAPKRPYQDTIKLLPVLLVSIFLPQALRHAHHQEILLLPDSLRAAMIQPRMLPFERVLHRLRTTLKKDSTNSTRYGTDVDPFFTCTCLSERVCQVWMIRQTRYRFSHKS